MAVSGIVGANRSIIYGCCNVGNLEVMNTGAAGIAQSASTYSAETIHFLNNANYGFIRGGQAAAGIVDSY